MDFNLEPGFDPSTGPSPPSPPADLYPEVNGLVEALQQAKGLSRGDAIGLVLRAYEQKQPNIVKLPGIDAFLEEETSVGAQTRSALKTGVEAAVGPVASVADLVTGKFGSDKGMRAAIEEGLEPGYRSSAAKGLSVAAQLAGGSVAFAPLEAAGAALGLPEYLGAKAAGLSARELRSLREPALDAAKLTPDVIKRLSRAGVYSNAARVGLPGGVLGALEDPEHPAIGAGVGAGLGGVLGALAGRLDPVLSDAETTLDRRTSRAYRAMAGLRGESPEATMGSIYEMAPDEPVAPPPPGPPPPRTYLPSNPSAPPWGPTEDAEFAFQPPKVVYAGGPEPQLGLTGPPRRLGLPAPEPPPEPLPAWQVKAELEDPILGWGDRTDVPARSTEDVEPAVRFPEGWRVRATAERAKTVAPQVESGMTRLYRATGTGPGVPDWVKQGAKETGQSEAYGRWFTKDVGDLQWYIKDSGPNAKISYVDVPTKDVEAYQAGKHPNATRFSRNPSTEYFVPREVADQAGTFRWELPAKPVEPTMPTWLKKWVREQGQDPGKLVDRIKAHETLTPEQKSSLIRTGQLEGPPEKGPIVLEPPLAKPPKLGRGETDLPADIIRDLRKGGLQDDPKALAKAKRAAAKLPTDVEEVVVEPATATDKSLDELLPKPELAPETAASAGESAVYPVGQAKEKARRSLLDYLASERGAVGRNVPPEEGGLFTPPKGAKRKYKMGPKKDGVEARVDGSVWRQALVEGVDDDAAVAGPVKVAIEEILNEDPGFAKSLRVPSSVFARAKQTAEMFVRALDTKGTLLSKLPQRYGQRAQGIWNRYNIVEADKPAFFKALSGIRLRADGSYEQTLTGVDKRIGKAALEYRRRIYDPVQGTARGYDPKVAPILDLHGLVDDGKTLRLLRGVQDGTIVGSPLKPIPTNVQAAADATQGMLKWGPTHDLDSIGPYVNGFYHHLGLTQAKADLAAELADLTNQSQQPFLSSAQQTMLQTDINRRAQILKRVEEELVRVAHKGTPNLGKIPQRHAMGPLEFAREVDMPEAGLTLADIHERVVHKPLTKRYYDSVLHDARATYDSLSDPDMKAYLTSWVNGIRGVKATAEDAWIRSAAKKWAKFGVTEDWLREEVSNIQKVQVLTKLMLSPRFALFVNPTQTFQTLWPIVGTKVYTKALLRATRDLPEFLAMKAGALNTDTAKAAAQASRNIWVQAKVNGILGEGSEKFMREAQSLTTMRHSRVIDKVVSKFPTTRAAAMTEAFNRVVSYEAGRIAAAEKGFQPSKLLRTYTHTPGRGLLQQQHAYGRAMVDATQFIMEQENRPTAFVGGAHRRLAGQFRTFGVAYSTLFKDAVMAAKSAGLKGIAADIRAGNGDSLVAARMASALMFMGGLGTFPLYEGLRSWSMRHAGWDMPDRGLVGWGWHALRTHNSGIPNINMDITSSVEPFNLPRDLSIKSIGEYAMGPTFGSAADYVDTAWKEGSMVSPEAVKMAIRGMFGPGITSLGEVAVERSRGGVRTDSGRVIANRSWTEQLPRALNMAPSVRAQFYNYRKDIKDAMMGGRQDVVNEIIREAKRNGLYLTGSDLSSIRGEVKRTAKRQGWRSAGDLFSR